MGSQGEPRGTPSRFQEAPKAPQDTPERPRRHQDDPRRSLGIRRRPQDAPKTLHSGVGRVRFWFPLEINTGGDLGLLMGSVWRCSFIWLNERCERASEASDASSAISVYKDVEDSWNFQRRSKEDPKVFSRRRWPQAGPTSYRKRLRIGSSSYGDARSFISRASRSLVNTRFMNWCFSIGF